MNQTIKILVVDDDPDILYATCRIAKSAGYEVFAAATGTHCLKMVRENLPDLVLLDVMLPDMEGAEVCRQIKADPLLKNPFVVLISGLRTGSIDQADGLNAGADGYIARPISNQELKARISSLVRILTAERKRDELIAELKLALSQIKQLSGLIPICAHCKKIRNDQGYWDQVEVYIQKHTDAVFSHSICQACIKKHYPDFDS